MLDQPTDVVSRPGSEGAATLRKRSEKDSDGREKQARCNELPASARRVEARIARSKRYRGAMAASPDKVTVSLDASIVQQAREQLGEPAAGLADGAVIERAVNAYLLRRMVDATQAATGLSEEEAERVAYEELAALRRERRGSV